MPVSPKTSVAAATTLAVTATARGMTARRAACTARETRPSGGLAATHGQEKWVLAVKDRDGHGQGTWHPDLEFERKYDKNQHVSLR